MTAFGGRSVKKGTKLPLCRNLVKPPGPSIFFQAADSGGNINIEMWRVYPLQFASLEIEGKSRKQQARPEIRLAPFSLECKLKKQSGNSRARNRQTAPLVRGPLKTKEKGELAELAFLHKAASLGFGVARPHGDSERYDFILDSGERFWRVQVKSIFCLVEGIYRARCTHGDKIPYTAEEIDFLVAYIAPEKIWYIIPLHCTPASGVLAFYPSGRERGSGRFERFREAWHLMAPGADLPQPRILRHARSTNLHRRRFVE
jgi:hypothetical protein